jgi:lipopolysaccharide transport system ATP-binding protein
MGDISKGEGRTILFVSHNLPAVKSLCRTGIFLENGKLKKEGDINSVLRSYLGGDELISNHCVINSYKNNFQLIEVLVRADKKDVDDPIVRDDNILLEISYNNTSDSIIHFTIKFKNEDGQYIITSTSQDIEHLVSKGINKAVMTIPSKFFNDGIFYLDLLVVENRTNPIIVESDLISFTVNPEVVPLGFWMGPESGYIRMPFDWQNIQL